jgi:hypothetical protein
MSTEQLTLDTYYAATDASEALRKAAKARRAVGIVDLLRRDIGADRDHHARILAAADKALAQIARRATVPNLKRRVTTV